MWHAKKKTCAPRVAEVRFLPTATDDLFDIAMWIAERADWDVARDYVARVEAACRRLAHFPLRGTPRDELGPGMRSIPFERRLVIVYRIEDETVEIIRCLASGRDPAREFY